VPDWILGVPHDYYKRSEVRKQKAEGRRQKAEGRRQKAEGRRQKIFHFPLAICHLLFSVLPDGIASRKITNLK
jgi:hypothetical protein